MEERFEIELKKRDQLSLKSNWKISGLNPYYITQLDSSLVF